MCSNFWGETNRSIDIEKARESFVRDFQYIISLGYVESHRSHNTGIGKTFEDLMEVEENNLSTADYKGCIELKSQRSKTSSMLSLFTKSPSSPPKANSILRQKYGYPDTESGFNILHSTIKYSSFNQFKNKWGFKLEIDEKNKRLVLLVKNLRTNELEEFKPFWDFKDLNTKISTKCSLIAYITAESKELNQKEYFHFTKAILLSGLTLEKFIMLIRGDIILFDIRIGAYRSGKNKGKIHDHGSGFRVHRRDIPKVFNIEEINLTPSVNNFKKPKLKREKKSESQIEITKYLKTDEK
ncbi:hypothetical protein LCGC14_1071040 [marine sediment metagenome]|uniref:MvaI/BcnI restriction endonuclease domain-containing protein n=1 Tax=marine sediment metagenome TaxID=412755 RepID=A0A0F9N5F5_9ZZZZ